MRVHKDFGIGASEILRAQVEAWVERLIALLDQLDGDADLEEGGDMEPSFGTAQYGRGRLELELEEDRVDDEPCLSWAENFEQTDGILAEGFDPELFPAPLHFDGKGARAANVMLRSNGLRTVRLPIGRGE